MFSKLLITTATIALAAASAQPGPGRRGTGGQTPPTQEQMVERRVEHMTLLLSLTPSQQTQATTIFTEEAAAAAALRTPMQEAQSALKNAVESRLTDAQIDAAAAKVGSVQGQMAGVRGKAQAKFLGILTQEQRDKLAKLRPGPGGPGGGPMMGGMGGRGWHD